MPEDKTVTDWILDMKRGDPAAVEAVWDRFFDRLCAVVRRKLGPAPRRLRDEEDIATSAIYALWQGARDDRFRRLEGRNDLWQMLVLVASRKVIDAQRKALRRPEAGESALGLGGFDAAVDFITDGQPDGAFVGQMSVAVEELFDALEPKLARVARMRLEGHSNAEIAQVIGRQERTVERYIAMVRHRWNELGPGAPA